MNSEKCTDKLILGSEAVICFKINRRKRRLPVVAMHNLGIKVDKRHYFKHCAREKRKSLSVVIIAIAAGALEIELVVDKVKGYAVLYVFEYTAILISPRKMNVQIALIGEFCPVLLLNIRIKRHNHADVVSARCGKRL